MCIVQLLLEGYRDHQLAQLKRAQNERVAFELSTLDALIGAPAAEASNPPGGSGSVVELLFVEAKGSDAAKVRARACMCEPRMRAFLAASRRASAFLS